MPPTLEGGSSRSNARDKAPWHASNRWRGTRSTSASPPGYHATWLLDLVILMRPHVSCMLALCRKYTQAQFMDPEDPQIKQDIIRLIMQFLQVCQLVVLASRRPWQKD